MIPSTISLRPATEKDAEALLEIYAPYVTNTAITFEYTIPFPEEFRSRISNTLRTYPYLVAEQDQEILGYAYTGPFKSRAAYDWSVETSIYLKMERRKQGIGKRLYQALETVSKAQHILNMNACIAYPETEDEYLTKNSVEFHSHLGYQMVGKFHSCGCKFGRWYHMVWMEKMLGEHPADPELIIPFSKLKLPDLNQIF